MKPELRLSRKILLLSAYDAFYNPAKSILQSHGFEVLEDYGDGHQEIDAVLLDPFFLYSSRQNDFHKTLANVPVIGFMEHEGPCSSIDTASLPADQLIFLPTDWSRQNTYQAIEEAFNQCEYLNMLCGIGQEFGAGLWTFLTQQISELSSTDKYSKLCF